MIKRGTYSRSRSLLDMENKFFPNVITDTIRKLINNKSVNILEIGCGEGRVLMEILKKFPTVNLYGINKHKWGCMKGSESLKQTGLFYKIFSNKEQRNIRLPKITFCDAEELPFENNFFDLIISQVTLQYVIRKDKALEEIWRVSKLGGRAFLEIDYTPVSDYPDFMNNDTPRFVIYKNGKLHSLKKHIGEIQKLGYKIKYQSTSNRPNEKKIKPIVNLFYYKNIYLPLSLNLEFDKISSFDLNLQNTNEDRWSHYWGYRSVYNCLI